MACGGLGKDDLVERFGLEEDSTSGCLLWQGAKNRCGYGHLKVGAHTHLAHRFIYETYRDVIPEGLQLDHLCRRRDCVNPDHLEPVTARENTRRAASVTS